MNKYITYILLLLIMIMHFQFNRFDLIDSRFMAFQMDSESLVIGRLAYANEEGITAHSCMLGLAHTASNGQNIHYNQYQIFDTKPSINHYAPYHSHSGGQGIYLFYISKLFNLEGLSGIGGLQFIMSTFTALVFLLFCIWTHRVLGSTPMAFLIVGILFIPWIGLFARNLYWCLGVFYLPFAIELWWLNKHNTKFTRNWSLLLFTSIFIKTWFTGFEYVTTFIIMLWVPIVFYSIWRNWSLSDFLKCSVKIACIIGGAYFIVCLILIFQLSNEKGTIMDALYYILNTFEKRTTEGILLSHPQYTLSYVLNEYWHGEIFNSTHWNIGKWDFLKIKFTIKYLSSVLLFFSLWVSFKCRRQGIAKCRLEIALFVSLVVAFLAPLSWFIIFKEHSAAHFHMNNIIWQMPFSLWGLIFIAVVVQNISNYGSKKII